VFIGSDVERALDFQLELGPADELMRGAGALGTASERRVRDEVRRLFAPNERDGGVWLPSSIWHASGVASG
jgi:hypothetical protein